MTTRSVLLVAAFGLACTPKTDEVGELADSGNGSGSAEGGTADTGGNPDAGEDTDDGGPGTSTDPPTSGDSASGTDGAPGGACSDILDSETCNATRVDDLPCEWQTFTPVAREGDVCEEMAPVQLCVQLTGDTTAAGCGTIPGCEDSFANPFYRVLDDGTVLFNDYCGGSPPAEWSACETGFSDDDVPECACLCELAAGSGTGSTG